MNLPGNWISTWSETPLVKALAWTLLHFLWEAALIALLLAALLYLCRLSPARGRYAAACLALIAMPLSFGLTVTWELSAELSAPRMAHSGPLRLIQPDALDSPAPITAAPEAAASPLWRWAVPVWLAGVLLFYVRSLGGWFAVQRLRRTGVVAAGAEWQARLHVLRSRLGVARAVALVE